MLDRITSAALNNRVLKWGMTPSEALSLSHSVLGEAAVLEMVRRVRTEAVGLMEAQGFAPREVFLIDRLAAGRGHQLSARASLHDPATGSFLSLYVLLAVSVDQEPVMRSRMWLEVRDDDEVRYAQPEMNAMPGAAFLWPAGWAPGVLTSLELDEAHEQLQANLLQLPQVGRVSWDHGDSQRFVSHLVDAVVPGN